ncbi:MAG: dTDP-4-dehydrorhamnose reductase [Methanobrevibacter sp.]|jgi:dTDP-4-dehydrorhamnose reductase|nr:dTDP-4-dehydrorhamnose reductase [Methanobrevibacter sp.]
MGIWITGYKGMLGYDLVKILNNDYELILTDKDTTDITNLEEIKEIVKENEIDLIINVAAYTNVDGSESNKQIAYEVNAIGAKNLAIIAKEHDIKLIYISSDYVFNGNKSNPYIENDKTDPINYYGETKLQGEKFIQETMDKYFIIRTQWLYGINNGNFVKTMLKLAENNNEINVVNDQYGSPTFTKDLAIAISQLIKSDKYGLYHVTNSGECSWFEFAKLIFEIANIKIKLNSIVTSQYPTPAKRPKYSVLSNEKWLNEGFKPLRLFKDGLNEYMDLELTKS